MSWLHRLYLRVRYRRTDPRRYGADQDGKTDCTEAVQRAIDAAVAGDGIVRMGRGTYRMGGAN